MARFSFRILSLRGTAALSLIVWLVMGPSRAEARGEAIANLTAEFKGGFVVISAELINAFSPVLVEDIKNGIPKDLYYTILLKRRKAAWFDEEVASRTILFRVKADLLKKQYLVLRKSGREEEEIILDDYASMGRLISRIEDVKIASLGALKKRTAYYVSVKAEMKATNIPLYLDYVLFFVPFLEVDTPWADSAPFYRPDGNRVEAR